MNYTRAHCAAKGDVASAAIPVSISATAAQWRTGQHTAAGRVRGHWGAQPHRRAYAAPSEGRPWQAGHGQREDGTWEAAEPARPQRQTGGVPLAPLGSAGCAGMQQRFDAELANPNLLERTRIDRTCPVLAATRPRSRLSKRRVGAANSRIVDSAPGPRRTADDSTRVVDDRTTSSA
jgi:hypothetical protein